MPEPMIWHDGLLLGHGPMDDTHREFVACVAAVQGAPDEMLAQRLAEFERHAEAHFGDEARWMQASAFPASECHLDEHAKVLASVHEVQAMVAEGDDLHVVRQLAQALADWFPGHADYMDAALSHWLSQRSHGGAPVVLKRQVAAPAQPTSSPSFSSSGSPR